MFDLKCIKLICELANMNPAYEPVWPHQIKPVKFGYAVEHEEADVALTLASQMLVDNVGLGVARVQCYMVNTDITTNDYGIWRTFPPGIADWYMARTAGGASVTNFTATSAPGHLPLDCDELLWFPPGHVINLRFTPSAAPPATGTWIIRTTVFGFFVPPQVYDRLGQCGDWINVQQ